MTDHDKQAPGVPQPDPALKRLDRLAGTWSMRGHLVNSDVENIIGEATFQWLEGGFFLQNVYSNLSPVSLPYKWDLRGDTLTISVSYGALDATFQETFNKDGISFSGGWRPNPGADASINVPYDIAGTRLK